MPEYKYRIPPSWWIIKNEILTSLYKANNFLAKHQQQPNVLTARQFAAENLKLYRMLRTKIYLLDEKPKDKRYNPTKKYEKLKKLLDTANVPTNPNMHRWTQIYYILAQICEELGITKIEVKQDKEYDPEESILDGVVT